MNVKMNEGTHVKWLFSGNLQTTGVVCFCVAKDTSIFESQRKKGSEVIDNFAGKSTKNLKRTHIHLID
jgi:hypothetical protein